MEAAVNAGEPQTAEQARLTAYAFFEFGPEIKLRAFDPGLALEVEGLIWYGAEGEAGLAQLIADDAGINEIRETRLVARRGARRTPRRRPARAAAPRR